MNTNEINQALRNMDCFEGTFSRDMLPPIKKRPFAIVANTDSSDGPGQHWVAFFFNDDDTAEYFDPYGLPPLFLEFKNYLITNAKYIFYSNTTLQSFNLSSNVCGNYCVLFVRLRCAGLSFCHLLSLFSNNQSRNDMIVKAFTK